MRNAYLVLVLGLLLPATVFAEDMAGLQVTIESGVDPLVAADARSALTEAFSANKNWSYVDEQLVRNRLNPVVRDCFTKDCLIKAGQQAEAKAGIRIHLSGEAQIYDWTVETFDLRTGVQMAIRKGACELCGRNEVARTFRSSLDGVLGESVFKATSTKTTPPKETTPVTEKTTTTPVQTQTGDVRIVTIEISTEPPNALIMFRDAEVGRGQARVEVGPGEHLFTFTAEGHRTVKELVVVEGDAANTTLRVHLPRKEDAPSVVELRSNGPVDRLGESRTVYGVMGTVFGLGLLGTGMYLNAIDGDPNCDSGSFTSCPEVYNTGTAAFLTTFTGATLLTAGGILLAWEVLAHDAPADAADAPAKAPAASLKMAPIVSSDGGGFSLFGRF